MNWQSLKDHLFELVAGAAMLGVGGATVTNLRSDAVQEVRLEQLEGSEAKIDQILLMTSEANERLAKIEGKLEGPGK
jgi:hypothetical protein